ncbi:MAG TPA: hypothetical protein VK765_03920 [Solirubrobacteraceae bacterium]|nr:hypothetical protein [Solirubrobacteraceae bacterium]
MQIAAYSATAAALPGVGIALVGVVVLGVELEDVLLVVDVGVLVAAVVAAGVLVEVLVVVEPLLPHPASSAPHSSTAATRPDRIQVI